ncbi:hypothetical protein [Streptomyces sp. NPDC055992]|uniref:hypothetical protein n=1 Tax=Streptomyces sp. NPDC055992 TaxID=3345673 RepID=UPI0035DA8382
MTLRRLGFLSAALLATAALTACTAETTKADDPKPATTVSGSTNPSGAPGGAPENAGLPLVEAIKRIPVAAEKRTGYERDSFKHWGGTGRREKGLVAAEEATRHYRVLAEANRAQFGANLQRSLDVAAWLEPLPE